MLTVQHLRRQAAGPAPPLLAGDDPTGAYDDTVALITAAGFRFALAPPGSTYLGDANGVTLGGSLMLTQVRDDLSLAHRVKTTLHELAHIRCGHLSEPVADGDLHRGRRETEAESVSHIICQALGLDTAAFTDAYVLGWAGGDLNLVEQCAQRVLRVSREILADLTPDITGGPAAEPGATGT
ncbi:hypothetical protein ACQP2F_14510 [Actinoplanes sp. CA-030573]|uniref:hypothetical protein n=1 Tax=Actinoplanes sp. CA-030573 TaxID=3239898 RepID=UPI003D8B4795